MTANDVIAEAAIRAVNNLRNDSDDDEWEEAWQALEEAVDAREEAPHD